MKRIILCSTLIMSACAAPSPVALTQASAIVEGRGPQAAPSVNTNRSAADTQDIVDLLQETLRVIRLPAFARNLSLAEREFGLIRQSPTGQELSAESVAGLYAGRDPRYVFHPASIDWTSGGSATRPDGTIWLAHEVRTHWRSNRPLGRSLAINTLAHELAHTLSSSPDGPIAYVFTDSGFSFGWLRGWPPVASYTIGSAAQCTYLEERNALRGSIVDCLRRYGVARFKTYARDDWDIDAMAGA